MKRSLMFGLSEILFAVVAAVIIVLWLVLDDFDR